MLFEQLLKCIGELLLGQQPILSVLHTLYPHRKLIHKHILRPNTLTPTAITASLSYLINDLPTMGWASISMGNYTKQLAQRTLLCRPGSHTLTGDQLPQVCFTKQAKHSPVWKTAVEQKLKPSRVTQSGTHYT